MKVLFQYQGLITENYKQYFRMNIPAEVEIVYQETPDKEFLLNEAPSVDIFVGYTLTKEFLDVATNLRHIQIPWTGFNNFGQEYLKDRTIITVSNSHSNSLAIAEHAVSLFLSAAKLIPHRDSSMRTGDWSTRYTETNSFWLVGKKLGVVGYGSIGKKVAKMMKGGFDMEVLAIKRHPDERDHYCDFLGGMDDLDYVLQASDFLLIATPLTSETEGLLDDSKFDLMKSNLVLVNIARGPIIKEESLFNALKENKIGAAGIDVWYNYPSRDERVVEQNLPFHELQNIVMTPHSAFKIRDREEIFAKDILENILRIYGDEIPINQVNLDLGY